MTATPIPAEVARLEEARQAIGTAELAGTSEHVAGGILSWGGPGSWANQGCGLGMSGPVSPQDIAFTIDFYRRRNAEPRLEVCPYAHPSLFEGLAAHGFVVREFENVFARHIDGGQDFRALLPHGWPRNLSLPHVDPTDTSTVRAFIDVSTSGFRPPDQEIDPIFLEITRRMVEHPRNDSFAAHIDGVLVGGSAMETSGRLACLFGTSVLPEFQGRGVQSAMIARRLERARERGADLVTIHTLPGIPTERNALRLGFVPAYTKAVMVLPTPGVLPSI